ncbi:hypothetical protein [Nocardioides pocheonensis]|uniref:Uncharacterized protein n=1 Tax=Nocardioides pocheonensis TaxID=661485 RepID=A0A3N0GTE3_9ACTN|nr:hypothetical protein [Nocardioides pocheonensis]RNM15733.1 hypothetical protein EFL26_05980 [Nocardioides pocheonensis]
MSLVATQPWVLVTQWSTRSQEQARRNAMAACTDLAARRLERLDVEAFIADFMARRAAAAQPASSIAGVG